MDLAGKIALVTGGSGDLGAAIAKALAQAGASVAITYVGERERAEETAAAVQALGAGAQAWTVQLDQLDAQQAEVVIGATVERFGRLDILVNNAAWNIGIPFADLDTLTPDIWDRMYDTNLRGPFLLARAAARPMRAQHSGRIVEYRLGCWHLSLRQQHRLRHQQSRADSSDALPGRGAGPGCAGQLRRAGADRGHAHGAPSARPGDRRGAQAGGAGPLGLAGRPGRPGGRLLPFRQRDRPDAAD